MNGIMLVFVAAGFSAWSNLFFRKNSSKANSPNGYLLLYYFSAFIFSFFIDQTIWKIPINYPLLLLGSCVGLLSAALMLFIFQALKNGPAGTTFAFQNASAAFPGLSLFLLFGAEMGYSCSYLQLGGIFLVLFGLYLGAKQQTTSDSTVSSSWLKYALACFCIQVLALTIIQGRCVLFNDIGGTFFHSLASNTADDIWFMPGQFGAATCLQFVIFLREKRKMQSTEVAYGFLGGTTNLISTFLQLLATKIAAPSEQAIIFPCFAVGTIILCNLWANRLYNERFNLSANVVCSTGIFLGMFNPTF